MKVNVREYIAKEILPVQFERKKNLGLNGLLENANHTSVKKTTLPFVCVSIEMLLQFGRTLADSE